jgi:colanic acid/amylovoran biosynthesis glycosyltransferase
VNSICYLVNSFPEPSESYVSREIVELRRRGYRVVPCAFRKPKAPRCVIGDGATYVFPLSLWRSLVASWMFVSRFGMIADLLFRAMRGPEPYRRRFRSVLHTWLGAYLAVVLKREGIGNIHVHHGFFSSWCAMVAGRLLNVDFSMTLHGSDLLVRADYLDCKLRNCRFCFTISEYNRNYLLDRYPFARRKLAVHRVGIDLRRWQPTVRLSSASVFNILNVGRLHSVKNQGFLVLACRALKTARVPFVCNIVGDGDERERLQRLINELQLTEEVRLLGHVDHAELRGLYAEANAVVLTSQSEGIPLVLMEAMAMEQVVLAPAMTGIPELITSGETGFLYQPGSMDDFLAKLTAIRLVGKNLDRLRRAARRHIELNYDSRRNVALLADDFVQRINRGAQPRASQRETDEDSLLQQVQLRV